MLLSAPASTVSATYPENPEAFLEISSNGTVDGGTVLWKLDWVHDPTSVSWIAVPGAGLLLPGATTRVSPCGERLYPG